MDFQDIIAAKRDGRPNSSAELRFLAEGASDGSLSDEELTAWLHAAFANTLSPKETADLTLAMAESGERLDLADDLKSALS